MKGCCLLFVFKSCICPCSENQSSCYMCWCLAETESERNGVIDSLLI